MGLKYSNIITGEVDENFCGQSLHIYINTHTDIKEQKIKFLHVPLLYGNWKEGRKEKGKY